MFSWFAGKSDLLDKAAAGIDALILTDEERITYNLKRQEAFLELEKEVNKQSMPRALTRRYLALLVTIPYILAVIIKSAIEFLSALAIIPLVDLSNVASTLELYTTPFSCIIIFYFGTHIVDRIKK